MHLCSNRSKRKVGPPSTVPSPPPRALPADTTAQQQRKQPLIPLLRCSGLPESPLPLLRRSCLPETPGRYGTGAVMAAVSYSLRLARRHRLLPACVAGTASAEAATAIECHVLMHARSLIQRRLIVNCDIVKSLPLQLTLFCADEILQAYCVLNS